MANDTAKTITTNIVPVQGIFQPAPTFDLVSLIGPAGTPFFPNIDPDQSGLNITNSVINSTTIGLTTPAAGKFTVATLPNAPVNPTDATNKSYVDNFVAGIAWKEPALCATTANITLSGTQTIDNVAVVVGDRVLVKNQSNAAENGIYVVASGPWTRAVGADDYAEYEGAVIFVISGSGNAGTTWYCSAQPGGTLGVTALNWFSLSISLTYTAGTGLTLTGTQFSITNTTVTAGAYGGASKTLTATVNAQGQLTALAETAIAIANTQVSGLGTMSTQNANGVAVTGGSIDGTTVGSSTASTVRGTTITATTQFTGPGTGLTGTASSLSIGGNAATVTNGVYTTDTGTVTNTMLAGSIANNKLLNSSVTINGNTVSLGGSTTITAQNPNALTIGTGLSGTSYDGSTAVTIANTGVLSIAGTANQITASASTGAVTLSLPSTINVNISGNAATATSATSATSATTATNIAGGASGSLPYQTGSGATALLGIGSTGQVLKVVGGLPAWASDSSGVTIVDDTTTNATRYLTFVDVTTGNVTTENVASTKLTFNPSSGVLSATSFSGAGSFTTLSASGVATFSAGTVSAPAITTSGDTNTGLFFPAADTIAFSEGGVESMRIDSSGNVGIGTSSPAKRLAVQNATDSTTVGTNAVMTIQAGSSVNSVAEIGFGYNGWSGTNPLCTLGYQITSNAGVGSGALTFSTRNVTTDTAPTERMRINSSGNVGIGTSSPTAMLHVAGSSSIAAFKTPNIVEVSTVSATAATGTINYDVTTQSVLYYTSNASGNFTVNFRGSSGTSLNTIMATGDTMVVSFLVTNGSTAYYNSAVQVDGSSVTPKWQGGTAPTSGNANSIDAYTYAIVKTGSAAFTVFASQTKFA